MKLGSLFDGSGTAPLAAVMCGIEPAWASEVEPYPISVTKARFPEMKHLGSILDVRGDEVEPVDIICGGSPCQDLSVAGKQAGIHNGERSHLFFEMVRIIREMREATNGEYPKYVIWENVPGAFSSNGGRDFHAVLQSFAEIAKADVHVSRPPRKGRTDRLDWRNAGSIVGDVWSIAWRVVDAQYWGVPQRRRRIYLVLDLADERAGEILFESEGLSGYTPPGREARQGAASSAEESTGETGLCLNDQGGCRMDVTHEMTSTLRAEAHHPPCVLNASGFCTEHSADSRGIGYSEEESPTLKTRSGCEGGGKGPLIKENMSATLATSNDQTLFAPKVYGICSDQSNSMLSDNPRSGIYEAETSRTLDTSGGNPSCNQGGMAVVSPMLASGKDQCGTLTARASAQKAFSGNQEAFSGDYYVIEPMTFAQNQRDEVRDLGDVSGALAAEPGMKQQTFVLQGSMIGRSEANGPQGDGVNEDVSFTLNTIDRHAVCAMNVGFFAAVEEKTPALPARDYKDPPIVSPAQYLVRRLTPTECARLQGFPDWWEDGVEGSDSARYRMWGNGMALPNMLFVMRRIAEHEREATT